MVWCRLQKPDFAGRHATHVAVDRATAKIHTVSWPARYRDRARGNHLEYLLLLLLLSIRGINADVVSIATTAALELAILSLNLMFFVILIRIILSWVAPGNYSPVTAMLNALAEPVLRPFRRMIPPIGGLDISPIFAIIILQAAIIILQTYKPIPV